MMKFFVGALMKKTRGRADPVLATELFKSLLMAKKDQKTPFTCTKMLSIKFMLQFFAKMYLYFKNPNLYVIK